MPALVTAAAQYGLVVPKLMNPVAAAAINPAITQQRGQVFQTGRMHTLGVAPPEVTGDGTLMPALIVGVGRTGRTVLQQLKRVITDRYGAGEPVPHVRFLYIDTDPEAGSAVNPDNDGNPGLAPREVVIARLNRPAHYLQHSHLPPVEGWMPVGSLYKLPRTPA